MQETEITKVQLTIRKFVYKMRELRKDNSKAGRWLDKFCDTLVYQDLVDDPEPLAIELIGEARKFSTKKVLTNTRNGQIKGARASLRKEGNENPSPEQIERRIGELYGMDAVTEERIGEVTESLDDSQDDCRETDESRETEQPKEETQQDPFYDFSPAKKDGPGMTINGVPFENLLSAHKREKPVDVPQPVPPKILNLAYSGEFGNVKLSQEQYNELGMKFGNQQALNRAIDSLSSKLENGEIQPVPKNHYAVLVKWAAYRDDKREEKDADAERNRYETVSEHNMRVLKKSTEFIMNGGLEKLKNGTIGTF